LAYPVPPISWPLVLAVPAGPSGSSSERGSEIVKTGVKPTSKPMNNPVLLNGEPEWFIEKEK
jgi:hypothetical protein